MPDSVIGVVINKFAGAVVLDIAKYDEFPWFPMLRVPVKGNPFEVITAIGQTTVSGSAVAVVRCNWGRQERPVGYCPKGATDTVNEVDTRPAVSVKL